MERVRHRGLEVVLGLALAGALVLGVVLVWDSFSLRFSDKITVSAELAKAGDALEVGDIVTYRSVIIGEVTDAAGTSGGGATAQLLIDPHAAAEIPASVTAVAVPASLFGTTKVELLPVRDPSGPRLREGSVIAADRSPAAESLQTALANAYTLLTAVHPAQLDAALSALATALDGQGGRLNTLIYEADRYLRKLAPSLPQLDDVIESLATVTDEIARNAPSLLSALANTLVVAKGILADRQAVAGLLAAGPTAADNARRLLSPRTVDNIVTVLVGQQPVTAALGANPQALPDTIHGFKQFADTFDQTLTSGSLKVNVLLTGADFAQLLPVAAGQKGTVFQAIVDPPLYTPADCPRYAGAIGPNCSGAGTNAAAERLLTSGLGYGGTSGAVGSAQEVRTIRAAAASITHLPAGQLHDATTDLLLGPLLRGSVTVVR
ncbi:MAG TPA: MCE family protein [Jatrophihabitans sp.]|uniref:MCE family protein n=1 Tax=Jatrophihabitans sp. TaxID=1932789 RepID=UPI002DFCD2F0|nr:MCE family protein [Jatrophihabitans sp.]